MIKNKIFFLKKVDNIFRIFKKNMYFSLLKISDDSKSGGRMCILNNGMVGHYSKKSLPSLGE